MQVILMLTLIGVASLAMGMGAMFNGDTIMINLQALGFGEQDLEPPVTAPSIDVSIIKFQGFEDGQVVFKNRIISCSFHYTDVISFDENLEDPEARIICKLLDCAEPPGTPGVVAEGSILGPFIASVDYFIPLDTLAFENADFSSEICDIQMIFIGPPPSPPAP